MKPLLFLFAILFFAKTLYAQEKLTIIKTDSSVIKVFHYFHKQSDEFFKGKNLVREIVYYDDDTTIAVERYLDTTLAFRSVRGISKSYDETGKLNWIIDNDKGILVYADTLKYPNIPLLNRMKEKGDSILKSIYGNSFFEHHVRWNIHRSNYFDKTYYSEPSFAIEWLREKTQGKYNATEFNIRYDIIYENRKLEEAIEIIIDRNGLIMPSHLWNENWTTYTRGLEKPDGSIPNFNLTTIEAIDWAKQLGLTETDSTKIKCNLEWENDSSSQIFNGHWRMNVYQETGFDISKYKKNDHSSETTHHFNVWVFNPWTREFIERKTEDKTFTVGFLFGVHRKPPFIYRCIKLIRVLFFLY